MEQKESKPLLKTLTGERLDPPPLWLMRQAGRYLPEYRAVRSKAGSFLDLCYHPELAAEVTLQPVRRFGLSAAILFADILLAPHAMGVDVRFEEGEGPRLTPVNNHSALAGLAPHFQRLQPVFETVQRVKRELSGDVALIGFAGAPWTVATYMIAGHGTADQAPAKLAAYRDPEFVGALIGELTLVTIAYLRGQIDAGAEAIQLFDTWAGGLPEILLETLVIAPTRAIVSALKASHPGIPIIGFPRSIGHHLPRYAHATGVDAVNVATGDDLQVLAALLPADVAMQGGLDPLALVAGGKMLRAAVDQVLRAIGQRPYVFNLGHGILPETPLEHVAELVRLVRSKH